MVAKKIYGRGAAFIVLFMHICVIAPDNNQHSELLCSLLSQDHHIVRISRMPSSWLTEGPPEFDRCLPWVMVRDLIAPHKGRFAAAQLLEKQGTQMVNSTSSILLSSDKRATHVAWASAGVPQPQTWLLDELTRDLAEDLPAHLIIKPSLSWGGKDVHRINNIAEARELSKDWNSPALVQEEILRSTAIRVIASDKAAFTAVEKVVDQGQLVAAIGLGAQPRYIPIDDDLRALAVEMVSSLGGGLMGVDILRDENGSLFALEANIPFAFNLNLPSLHQQMINAILSA